MKSPFKKKELNQYKELLVSLRARVRGDASGLASVALHQTRSEAGGDRSSMPTHIGDVDSDNFEQEFTLSLLEKDGGTLEDIEAALERIEESVYGLCVECNGRIPKTRLNVIPHTAHCVKCASKLEGS